MNNNIYLYIASWPSVSMPTGRKTTLGIRILRRFRSDLTRSLLNLKDELDASRNVLRTGFGSLGQRWLQSSIVRVPELDI